MISLARSLMVLAIANTVRASLYVTFPVQGDTCAVSQPCQIRWKDDNKPPHTSTAGETTIDLVMGNSSNLQPVQNLDGVSNPGVATAVTFTPNSGLSPTQQYAVRFIFKGNAANPIFSTYFSITGGSGTAKPLATSNSSSSSPGPIIGNKAPNGSASGNITSPKANPVNNTASTNASTSAASSMGASFHVMAVLISLSAIFTML